MFSFDAAIAGWRQQMAESGIGDSDILDELESHLRDEVLSQLGTGTDPRDAFEIAARQIGDAQHLKNEFANSFTVFDRMKETVLTLAGIPSSNLATNMNTSQTEPAWATYLKAVGFLLPAIFLATVAAIFVVPKLQEICRDVQMPTADGTFWNLLRSSILVMLTLREHGVLIAGAALCLVLLLEWRFAQWPRYRRAAIGFGAFILNSIVLFAFFMMFIAAILAAPALRVAK